MTVHVSYIDTFLYRPPGNNKVILLNCGFMENMNTRQYCFRSLSECERLSYECCSRINISAGLFVKDVVNVSR